jgi:hypothetical protein
VLASVLFLVFFLFLDDHDIFTIFQKKSKLATKQIEKARLDNELDEINLKLIQIQDMDELERFAREETYFKRDNEDVFVITTAKDGEFSK